jgi:hypothetical protein
MKSTRPVTAPGGGRCGHRLVSARYISGLYAAMSTRDVRGMILDDRRSATVKSAGHSGNGRGATYPLKTVGSSWPRARYGHPVPGWVVGRIFAHQVDEAVDGSVGNFALVLRRANATVRPTGRRLLVRTGAESTYAIGSRVPSMAARATSVRWRLWLRA